MSGKSPGKPLHEGTYCGTQRELEMFRKKQKFQRINEEKERKKLQLLREKHRQGPNNNAAPSEAQMSQEFLHQERRLKAEQSARDYRDRQFEIKQHQEKLSQANPHQDLNMGMGQWPPPPPAPRAAQPGQAPPPPGMAHHPGAPPHPGMAHHPGAPPPPRMVSSPNRLPAPPGMFPGPRPAELKSGPRKKRKFHGPGMDEPPRKAGRESNGQRKPRGSRWGPDKKTPEKAADSESKKKEPDVKYDAKNPFGSFSEVPEEEIRKRKALEEARKKREKQRSIQDFDYDTMEKHRVISRKADSDDEGADLGAQYGFGEDGFKEDGFQSKSKAARPSAPTPEKKLSLEEQERRQKVEEEMTEAQRKREAEISKKMDEFLLGKKVEGAPKFKKKRKFKKKGTMRKKAKSRSQALDLTED